jgi:predicted DNA-binding WGR domain protein
MGMKSRMAGGSTRYLEFSDGKSSKFWQFEVSGTKLTTRWGRIGTDGQSKVKTFASPAAAAAQGQKQLDAKLARGYREAKAQAGTSARNPAAKTSPLAPAVVAQLERLGAKLGKAKAGPRIPDCSWARRGDDGYMSWVAGPTKYESSAIVGDPEGQFKEMPEPAWYFAESVNWPSVFKQKYAFDKWGDGGLTKIEICQASECFDVDDLGDRLLLFQIASDENQFCYCIDLLDKSPDPAVYNIDHDGTDPSEHGKLSSFLGEIQRVVE